MSTPKIVTVLENILTELKSIRAIIDTTVSPEDREEFMSALTEQMADRSIKKQKKKGTPKV